MWTVDSNICLTCGGAASFRAHAIIAPWISRLSGSSIERKSKLFACSACGFAFFDHRFSDSEMSAIYESYRKEKYLLARNYFEPWYSQNEANAYAEGSKATEGRKRFLDAVFYDAGEADRVFHDCLDYGGDLGQFFPANAQGRRFVLDPSNATLVDPAIESVNSINEIPIKLSFIMNCNVLEHVPNFLAIFAEMDSALKSDGFLYVEVPQDHFKTSRFHRSNLYSSYLDYVVRHRLLLVLLDFTSGVLRQFFGRIPFFGIVKQSEHINYFSLDSITSILAKMEYEVLHTSGIERDLKQRKIKIGRMGILARKKEVSF